MDEVKTVPATALDLPSSVRELLPADIRDLIASHGTAVSRIEEIRLRRGRVVELVGVGLCRGPLVTFEHLQHVFAAATRASVYAFEQDLRKGFVTVAGGHRVGLAGRVALGDRGEVTALREVSSANIRIAREMPGCARGLERAIVDEQRRLLPTLLFGPPLCGKTTLLRDVARLLGDGQFHPQLPRLRVGIVDERSEIAGCRAGLPQFDIGLSTDVLDGCPKVEGMSMLLRSMAPQVLVTDELGGPEDARAVLDAAQAGVIVIGTVHARSPEDLRSRRGVAEIVDSGAFERFVGLGRKNGPGSIERVYDRRLREVTFAWR